MIFLFNWKKAAVFKSFFGKCGNILCSPFVPKRLYAMKAKVEGDLPFIMSAYQRGVIEHDGKFTLSVVPQVTQAL